MLFIRTNNCRLRKSLFVEKQTPRIKTNHKIKRVAKLDTILVRCLFIITSLKTTNNTTNVVFVALSKSATLVTAILISQLYSKPFFDCFWLISTMIRGICW